MLFPVGKTHVKLGIVLIEALLSGDSLYPKNKKITFSSSANSKYFFAKISGIDAKGIDVA